MLWLPEPEPGTSVCLGFDGSDVEDWTTIQAETMAGFSFTPRFMGGPTIWNPAEFHDHRIPRTSVTAAVDDLFDRFDVVRMYCDPPGWKSEIEAWSLLHGEDRVIAWETYRPRQMHEALERFVADIQTGRIQHDGCPIAARHIANAVKAGRRNDTYVLAKASKEQKIDAAMGRTLAHEAVADALASGWTAEPSETYFRLPR